MEAYYSLYSEKLSSRLISFPRAETLILRRNPRLNLHFSNLSSFSSQAKEKNFLLPSLFAPYRALWLVSTNRELKENRARSARQRAPTAIRTLYRIRWRAPFGALQILDRPCAECSLERSAEGERSSGGDPASSAPRSAPFRKKPCVECSSERSTGVECSPERSLAKREILRRELLGALQ